MGRWAGRWVSEASIRTDREQTCSRCSCPRFPFFPFPNHPVNLPSQQRFPDSIVRSPGANDLPMKREDGLLRHRVSSHDCSLLIVMIPKLVRKRSSPHVDHRTAGCHPGYSRAAFSRIFHELQTALPRGHAGGGPLEQRVPRNHRRRREGIRSLTGDDDPLHRSDSQQSPFGEPVAHGLLGLSVLAGLSTRSPNVATLALVGITEWQFESPIFFGDRVQVVTEIEEIQQHGRRAGRVTWRRQLLNQHGRVVQRGRFVSLVASHNRGRRLSPQDDTPETRKLPPR